MRANAPIYILLMLTSVLGFAAPAQENAKIDAIPDEVATVEGCDVFGGIPDVVTGMFPCPLADASQPRATIAAAPEPESD